MPNPATASRPSTGATKLLLSRLSTATIAELAILRLNAQFTQGPEPISEGYVIYLERIIALARANGAKVVLITTPVSREYWDAALAYVPIDDFYATIDALRAKHLDYHDMYFDRPEVFEDSDHLSKDAGSIFSARLKADLEAL